MHNSNSNNDTRTLIPVHSRTGLLGFSVFVFRRMLWLNWVLKFWGFFGGAGEGGMDWGKEKKNGILKRGKNIGEVRKSFWCRCFAIQNSKRDFMICLFPQWIPKKLPCSSHFSTHPSVDIHLARFPPSPPTNSHSSRTRTSNHLTPFFSLFLRKLDF